MSRLCSSTCMVTPAASATYTAETMRASISGIPSTSPSFSGRDAVGRHGWRPDDTVILDCYAMFADGLHDGAALDRRHAVAERDRRAERRQEPSPGKRPGAKLRKVTE